MDTRILPTQDESFEAVADELATLAPLRELALELRTYPVHLLVLLCEQHEQRGGPVPDHALKLAPYLGETALRALIRGAYIERVEDVSFAINAYNPTETGRALAARASTAAQAPRGRMRRS